MRIKEGNKEQDIIEAAVKVFAEVGFHHAKISKVAETAGVATGSVYVYYKNKDDLLIKIFENLWGKLVNDFKELTANTSLSPLEKINSMIDMVLDVFTENPSLALVFVNEHHNLRNNNLKTISRYYEKFLDEGEKVVREGIENGDFSSQINIKIFRYYIFGAIRNLLQQWANNPKSFPLEQIRQNIKFLMSNGIQKK